MKIFKKTNLFLLFIVLVAIFLRFYQLGSVPAGLTNDEANKGYDAYSILLTGKDQWGALLPLTNLKGFGDYPPPAYHYLSLIPIGIFGLSQFSIRIISALAGVISVVVVFFLAKKLFNERVGILSSLLFALMPWAIGLSRLALEVNLSLVFLLLALFFGLKNKASNQLSDLIFSSFFLVLNVYTYSAFILFSPLVLTVVLLENFYKKKINLKKILVPILLFLLLISPIFIKKDSASVRFSQVGITNNINSIGLINTLNMQRGQCLKQFPSSICKISENKIVLYSGVLVKNYLSHFSFEFLYSNGTETQFSILEKRGLDYIFSAIFLVLGILFIILERKKNPEVNYLLFLFLLSPIPDSLTSSGNYTRAALMIPFMIIISSLGLYFLISKIISVKKISRYFLYSSISLIIIFSVVSFFLSYLTYFKDNYSIFSQYGYKDLVLNININKDKYSKIIVSRHFNDTKQYIYYLFYNMYDPKKYQTKKNVTFSQSKDGWYSIDKIENIYFVQTLPTLSDSKLAENILLVSTPVDFPQSIKPVFLIRDKLGNVLFKAISSKDLLEYNRQQKLLKLTKNV